MGIRNEKGFTLTELLVAMLIFAIGVTALTKTLLATMKGNTLGSMETVATTLAYDKLEELRSIDPSLFDTDARLTAGTHANVRVVPQIIGGTKVVTSGGYLVGYNVSQVSTTNGALFYTSAKNVAVTVTWTAPASHSISIRSILVPNI